MTGPGDDAYTWGISGFCSWFILLWLPQVKSEDHTKHSNSLHYKALYTQLCTNWTGDSEMTPSWECCCVTWWGWICISFPLLMCTSTGSQEPFIRFFFFLFPRPFTAAMGKGLSLPSSLPSCLYPCFNNDSNANCHSPFIPKAADFFTTWHQVCSLEYNCSPPNEW